jgi:hypothetical protein
MTLDGQSHGLALPARMRRGRSSSAWLALVRLSLVAPAALALVCLGASRAHGTTISLAGGNASASFYTEAADGGVLGMNSWVVDGTDHMYQQWFWYRVGSQTQEWRVDGTGPLAHMSSTSSDVDSSAGDDVLLAVYADTETLTTPETFTVQLGYWLTGGTAGSGQSDMAEVIRVVNTGRLPLELHLFQYCDFDLNGTEINDAVVVLGGLANTVRQTDPAMQISETVVTPPPSHWQVGTYPSLRDDLDDGAVTTLTDLSGPLVGVDAVWAFQWDMVIPAGGTLLISKDKGIRPGEHIPEPSTLALLGTGVVGLLVGAWRRRRRAA